MTNKDITEHYRKNFENYDHEIKKYDQRWEYLWEPMQGYLKKSGRKPSEVRVLDAACGDGRYSHELFRRGFTETYAIDLFDSIPVTVGHYQKASMDCLPFDDNEFDIVFCFSAIYHLDDINKGFREFARCLKPGGGI